MHFARILARKDQAAAEQLLEQGFALAKEVDGDARSLLLSNAISLAAGSRRSTRGLSMAYVSDPLPGDAFSLALRQ